MSSQNFLRVSWNPRAEHVEVNSRHVGVKLTPVGVVSRSCRSWVLSGECILALEPTILTFSRIPRCPAGELGDGFAMPLKHTAHGRQNRPSTISIALSSLRALYALKSFAEKAPGSLHSNVSVFLCRVLHKQRGTDKFKWTDSRGQVVYQIFRKEGEGRTKDCGGSSSGGNERRRDQKLSAIGDTSDWKFKKLLFDKLKSIWTVNKLDVDCAPPSFYPN
jgi:hypothetical protein